jgi:Aromatic-ring-opening dioxygenase LigAB, LigA subunit
MMSRYQIDKLLRDLRRDENLARSFRDNAEIVMDRYKLEAEERALLKHWEIRKLYDHGVNPLLLLLAHGPAAGKSMQDYISTMNPDRGTR